MKSLVKNIFATIVALALLIGSTGFHVYQHSCAVHNYSAVSLFETPDCEKDHQIVEEVDDCCKDEVEEIAEPSCCEAKPIDKTNQVSFSSQETNCCITSFESLQIQDYLFPPVEKKIVSANIEFFFTEGFTTEKQNSDKIIKINFSDLPPPLYGIELLQTLHQLKLDTPFC